MRSYLSRCCPINTIVRWCCITAYINAICICNCHLILSIISHRNRWPHARRYIIVLCNILCPVKSIIWCIINTRIRRCIFIITNYCLILAGIWYCNISIIETSIYSCSLIPTATKVLWVIYLIYSIFNATNSYILSVRWCSDWIPVITIWCAI